MTNMYRSLFFLTFYNLSLDKNGASILSGVATIDNSTIENSASYINSWLRALKKDSRLILQAAAKAQKAADYLLGEQKISL